VQTQTEVKPLGELCEVLRGVNRTAKDGDIDPERRVIRAADFGSELASWSDLLSSDRPKKNSVEVIPGDIIGSISGEYARWAIVPDGYGNAVASDFTVVLRKRTNLSTWYLLEFLRSSRGRELLRETFTGTTIIRISQSGLKALPVPVLSLGAARFDRIVSGFEKETAKLGREVNILHSRLSAIFASDSTVEASARLDAVQGITAAMQAFGNLADISWIAKTSYPYPVARNLRAADWAISAREKYHEVVYETLEALSVTLSSMSAAMLRMSGAPDGKATKKWKGDAKRIGATIGTRISMIKEVTKTIGDRISGLEDAGGFPLAFGDESIPSVVLIESLVRERNRIHGDYPKGNLEFSRRLAKAENEMRQLLETLGFLARWELRYVESVEPIECNGGGIGYEARFRVLRGDNPDWVLVGGKSEAPVFRGRVYAFVDSRIMIDMHPFILVRECQVCSAREVYYPDSFSSDRVQLKSIDRGHSQTSDDLDLLQAIRAAYSQRSDSLIRRWLLALIFRARDMPT
jgi:hypothetical protein